MKYKVGQYVAWLNKNGGSGDGIIKRAQRNPIGEVCYLIADVWVMEEWIDYATEQGMKAMFGMGAAVPIYKAQHLADVRGLVQDAIATEREACAQIADGEYARLKADGFPEEAHTAAALAREIRARGKP